MVHPASSPDIIEAVLEIDGIDVVVPERDGIVEALSGADVFVSWRWKPEFLQPSLRFIQAASAGYDQFPLQDLAARGVVLASARGVHPNQVAEHAFALLLAMTRKVAEAIRAQSARRWELLDGIVELTGMTVAVVGLGAIGEEIARRASAWGMNVIGIKRDVGSYDGSVADVRSDDALIETLTEVDVAILVLPGGEETNHVIGKAELEALGSGWIVNVGRGNAIDEAALVDALTHGRLRGAGLDVFSTEPLPSESPLWTTPGVVVSPHVAGASPHYGARLAQILEHNLFALRGEKAWLNRIV